MGNTADGTAMSFEWNSNVENLSDEFANGPDFNSVYTFRVIRIDGNLDPEDYYDMTEPIGFNLEGGNPVTLTQSLMPDIQAGTITISDDILGQRNLAPTGSSGTDTDKASWNTIQIAWNFDRDPTTVSEYHVQVSVDGGKYQFLGQTYNGNLTYFWWTPYNLFRTNVTFMDGPLDGHTYQFRVVLSPLTGEREILTSGVLEYSVEIISTPTPIPPTNTPTPVPPTPVPTDTMVPPTPTPTSTDTPEPSTPTPIPPTDTSTPVPPTPVPTDTQEPPTPTSTSTETLVPATPASSSTNTPVPQTPTSTSTVTPEPPTPTQTPTNTPEPPASTPTQTYTPAPSTSTPIPNPTTGGNTITVDLPNLPGGSKPLEMVLVESGTFMIGSPEDEQDRDADEGPVKQVTLTKNLYIGKYEVTQAQYETVMGENPAREHGIGLNYPVYRVSWFEAAQFCNRLSEMKGLTPVYTESGEWPANMNANGYRLPTEAEWEYACRAGSNTRFYWGDDPNYTDIDNYAWYSFNSNNMSHEVGQKIPNNFGLYDMSGNLWEWCSDWYAGDYTNLDQIDPTGPDSDSNRVDRGGSWGNLPMELRSANRGRFDPLFDISSLVGFRVVRQQAN